MTKGRLRVVSLTNTLLRYKPSLSLQERLVAERKAGTAPDTLLIVQHHPVFTIGKRGTHKDFLTDLKELQKLDIDVVSVPRGGETTYHGPGQLVAYPIIDLRQLGLGARAFVEALEDAMIHTVGCFGIQAHGRLPGKTGVWVGERKIGAVGVRITHGVSSHGIALNVTTDLSVYKHIVPCGTPDKEVTSVLLELTDRLGQSQQQSTCCESRPAQKQPDELDRHHRHPEQQQPRWQQGGATSAELLKAAERCLVSSLGHTLGLQLEHVTNTVYTFSSRCLFRRAAVVD